MKIIFIFFTTTIFTTVVVVAAATENEGENQTLQFLAFSSSQLCSKAMAYAVDNFKSSNDNNKSHNFSPIFVHQNQKNLAQPIVEFYHFNQNQLPIFVGPTTKCGQLAVISDQFDAIMVSPNCQQDDDKLGRNVSFYSIQSDTLHSFKALMLFFKKIGNWKRIGVFSVTDGIVNRGNDVIDIVKMSQKQMGIDVDWLYNDNSIGDELFESMINQQIRIVVALLPTIGDIVRFLCMAHTKSITGPNYVFAMEAKMMFNPFELKFQLPSNCSTSILSEQMKMVFWFGDRNGFSLVNKNQLEITLGYDLINLKQSIGSISDKDDEEIILCHDTVETVLYVIDQLNASWTKANVIDILQNLSIAGLESEIKFRKDGENHGKRNQLWQWNGTEWLLVALANSNDDNVEVLSTNIFKRGRIPDDLSVIISKIDLAPIGFNILIIIVCIFLIGIAMMILIKIVSNHWQRFKTVAAKVEAIVMLCGSLFAIVTALTFSIEQFVKINQTICIVRNTFVHLCHSFVVVSLLSSTGTLQKEAKIEYKKFIKMKNQSKHHRHQQHHHHHHQHRHHQSEHGGRPRSKKSSNPRPVPHVRFAGKCHNLIESIFPIIAITVDLTLIMFYSLYGRRSYLISKITPIEFDANLGKFAKQIFEVCDRKSIMFWLISIPNYLLLLKIIVTNFSIGRYKTRSYESRMSISKFASINAATITAALIVLDLIIGEHSKTVRYAVNSFGLLWFANGTSFIYFSIELQQLKVSANNCWQKLKRKTNPLV